MAGALFFICMFLITVGGLLLFRPTGIKPIAEYSQPAAIEERKKVAVKMAQFLEKNPEIVKQKTLETLPVQGSPVPAHVEVADAPPNIVTSTPAQYRVAIQFQGQDMQFATLDEFNQWIYKNVMNEPIGFIRQLQDNDNPELYIETLKKVTEMNSSEPVANEVKAKYLEEARILLQNKDGYHQQMMQKALQNYLDLEKDRDLGKRVADELLKNQ